MVKTRENINEKYGGPINVKAPNLVCKIKWKKKKKKKLYLCKIQKLIRID